MRRTRYASDGSIKTALSTIPAHGHTGSTDGGTLSAAAIASGTLAQARGGLNTDVSALSGLLKNTAGVASAVAAPTGAVVGTSDSQTLTNKTLTAPTIADFTNMAHDHADADDGGQLTDAALSAAVSVPKGGTGQSSLTAESLLKGNGASAVGLIAPGSDGQALLSNGSAWAAGNLPIATIVAMTVMGGDAANIDLTSIPATFKHLLLILGLRSDHTATTENVYLRMNNDSTASDYFSAGSYVHSTAVVSGTQRLGATGTGIEMHRAAATETSGVPATLRSGLHVWIYDYTSTSRVRGVSWNGLAALDDASNFLGHLVGGGWWTNTADAINRLTILPVSGSNWKAGSFYSLYGVS